MPTACTWAAKTACCGSDCLVSTPHERGISRCICPADKPPFATQTEETVHERFRLFPRQPPHTTTLCPLDDRFGSDGVRRGWERGSHRTSACACADAKSGIS